MTSHEISIPGALIGAACCLISNVVLADTLNAIFDTATDVPLTTNSFTATGSSLNFTLNFAPETGTKLMVVRNTGLNFITGTFTNLAQGQNVSLSYGGTTYDFVANYYGGSGNDLVLVWANSRVYAWGNNLTGQLGDNTTTRRVVPAAVNAKSGASALYAKTVVSVAAGWRHSVALCSDGTVAAWGLNNVGQLGDNTITQRKVPVAVNVAAGVSALFGKTVVCIAAADSQTLALCSDGSVAAWGFNGNGRLGDNTTMQRNVPVAVNADDGISALFGKTVVAIAAGRNHSLALCSDGSVAAWGNNDYGQLGDNTIGTDRLVPVLVNRDSGVSALSGKTVATIAAGSGHSLALCSDGTLVAWGNNFQGELGDNTTTSRVAPVVVNTDSGISALFGKAVVAITAGGHSVYGHSIAMCSDGSVTAWGPNHNGQLGDDTTIGRLVPTAVNTTFGVSALFDKQVTAVAAGSTHSLALCSDGALTAWGRNDDGQLGDGTTIISSPYARTVPVTVKESSLPEGAHFTSASSGCLAVHTLGLVALPLPPLKLETQTDAGTFTFCWPSNYNGFIPQGNSNFSNMNGWIDLTNAPVFNVTNLSLTLPTSGDTRFFRLRSP